MHIGGLLSIPSQNARERPEVTVVAPNRPQEGVDPFEVRAGEGLAAGGPGSAPGRQQHIGARGSGSGGLSPPPPPHLQGMPFRDFVERVGEHVLPALQAAREEQRRGAGAAASADVALPHVPHLLPFTRW